MDEDQLYMENLKIDDVPWHRLTTAYGRAADFPIYFKQLWDMADEEAVSEALEAVTGSIEHQSTLWHAAPFAMIFLVRIFERAVSEMETSEVAASAVEQLVDFFGVMAECFREGDAMEHAEQLAHFSDLLKENYLWSEEYDEEEDEMRYEEDVVFPDDLFYSFYYYSYQALLLVKPILKRVENGPFGDKASELEELL